MGLNGVGFTFLTSLVYNLKFVHNKNGMDQGTYAYMIFIETHSSMAFHIVNEIPHHGLKGTFLSLFIVGVDKREG